MTPNEQTIHRFYKAFQEKDYETMQSCYTDDAIFSDPVFGLLDASQVRAMWEMLVKRANNFSLVYDNIILLDEEYMTCEWTATYTFAKTGRKVVNKIKAYMRLRDGLIIEHTDGFDIYRWSRQAFGLVGWLLGWTSFMQKKIQKQAQYSLEVFMARQ